MLPYDEDSAQELRKKLPKKTLEVLRKPNWYRVLFDISFDWISIILFWYLSYKIGLWFYFIAIFIIGNRQRALGNLLHDASHGSLLSNRFLNDWVSNIFTAIPLNNLLKHYRKDHIKHHILLGTKGDPDLIHKDSYNHCKANTIILENVFNKKIWFSSLLGNLPKMNFKELSVQLIWWIVVIGSINYVTNIYAAFLFLFLWYCSKITVFHTITTIRELSDHVGLNPISVLEFTRNSPSKSFLKYFIHPHNDNWHLVHHIIPYVPHYNLYKLDKLLSSLYSYNKLHHCDGYLFGKHALRKCLNGKCGYVKS